MPVFETRVAFKQTQIGNHTKPIAKHTCQTLKNKRSNQQKKVYLQNNFNTTDKQTDSLVTHDYGSKAHHLHTWSVIDKKKVSDKLASVKQIILSFIFDGCDNHQSII